MQRTVTGGLIRTLKNYYLRRFRAYGKDQLIAALRRLGVRERDTIMVHSSWFPNNGFRGSPVDFVSALKASVGEHGLLTMVSLSYHNESSAEFLARDIAMDVRRTPSRMGLLSEVFRRDPETQRSLSPTHPVLAWGRDAKEFLAGHEGSPVPFGPESPFARLLEREGKILLVDSSFASITFTHFLEDRLRDTLSFPLYEGEVREGIVIDYGGRRITVPTLVISEAANLARDEGVLIEALESAGAMARERVGNTRLERIECRAMTICVDRMTARKESFFVTQ